MSFQQQIIWLAAVVVFAAVVIGLFAVELIGAGVAISLAHIIVIGSVIGVVALILRMWVLRSFDEYGNWRGELFRRRKQ